MSKFGCVSIFQVKCLKYALRRCSIMAVSDLPKVKAWVRFPSSAQNSF